MSLGRLTATLERLETEVARLATAPERAEAARVQRGQCAAYEAGALAALCREHAAVIAALARNAREDANQINHDNEEED